MRQKAQQHLEVQLQRLGQQREATKQKLRALVRQTRQAQRARHGEYMELAGLAHLDPGALLGGLCELTAMLTDAERVARWKAQGDTRLETHRRLKSHRRRPTSSEDGDIANVKAEAL